MDIKKKLFTGSWLAWNRLPRAVGTVPSCWSLRGILKTLSDIGSDFDSGSVWSQELDLVILMGPFQLYDSMVL